MGVLAAIPTPEILLFRGGERAARPKLQITCLLLFVVVYACWSTRDTARAWDMKLKTALQFEHAER